jgi:hypothetical protein
MSDDQFAAALKNEFRYLTEKYGFSIAFWRRW